MTESAVKLIWRVLQTYADTVTWDEVLDVCAFACNVSCTQSTGESPFFLIHGYDPRLPMNCDFHLVLGEMGYASLHPWVQDKLQLLRAAWTTAQAAVDAGRAKQKAAFDQHRLEVLVLRAQASCDEVDYLLRYRRAFAADMHPLPCLESPVGERQGGLELWEDAPHPVEALRAYVEGPLLVVALVCQKLGEEVVDLVI